MLTINPFLNKKFNTSNPSKFNYKKELFDFIDKKRKDLNLSYRDIAYMFPGNNKSKIINEFMKFQTYGTMNKFYFNELLKILNISSDEIDAFTDDFYKMANEDLLFFIKNFEFIFSCRKKIWSNPELSNITFYGMGFSYAYISRDFPLTIGELLYHYENKSFVITNPNEPEYPTYIYYSCGSLLTGSNSYNGFNLKTRTPFYDKLSYGCRNQLMAISNYKKPYFSDVSTDLDIKQLTNILRKKTVF